LPPPMPRCAPYVPPPCTARHGDFDVVRSCHALWATLGQAAPYSAGPHPWAHCHRLAVVSHATARAPDEALCAIRVLCVGRGHALWAGLASRGPRQAWPGRGRPGRFISNSKLQNSYVDIQSSKHYETNSIGLIILWSIQWKYLTK
jgi:hypothetical protein